MLYEILHWGPALEVVWGPPLETMRGPPLEGQSAAKCHTQHKVPHCMIHILLKENVKV